MTNVPQVTWECPKCKTAIDQPEYVTAMTCVCKPQYPHKVYAMKRLDS